MKGSAADLGICVCPSASAYLPPGPLAGGVSDRAAAPWWGASRGRRPVPRPAAARPAAQTLAPAAASVHSALERRGRTGQGQGPPAPAALHRLRGRAGGSTLKSGQGRPATRGAALLWHAGLSVRSPRLHFLRPALVMGVPGRSFPTSQPRPFTGSRDSTQESSPAWRAGRPPKRPQVRSRHHTLACPPASPRETKAQVSSGARGPPPPEWTRARGESAGACASARRVSARAPRKDARRALCALGFAP